MSIELYRIDDRLIHGQVVVGWGQTLGVTFIVLVDDEVRASEWEQELYRMGVPPDVSVEFADVAEGVARLPHWREDKRSGIVLTGDVDTMARLCAGSNGTISDVNVGGVHFRDGRREKLRYVYLSDDESAALAGIAAKGVNVSAQDVPTARRVPLEELLG